MEMLNRITPARALMIGLVLAAFYYFVFFDSGVPQQANITNLRTQIGVLQKQIQDSQTKLDRAAVYKKAAAELGVTINKLLAVIPENFSISDLMKIISNETKVAGTSLTNIAPQMTEVSSLAKEFDELGVTVDMTGSFMQHMVFLSNLTKVKQIMIVRKFEMSVAQEAKADEAPNIKMTAEIVAYRYRGTGDKTGEKPAEQTQ